MNALYQTKPLLSGRSRGINVTAPTTILLTLMSLTIFTITVGLCFTTSGHQHHHSSGHQSQQYHGQAPQESLPQASHPHPPPPPPLPQANDNLVPHQHQQNQPPKSLQPPSGVEAGAGAAGSQSNTGKIIAAGALIGAAVATQQGLSRPTRHLTGGATKTFVDLSHPLHNGTLHWPSMNDIQYSVQVDADIKNKQGQSYYVKADSLSVSIHSGTHLDAPRHFSKTGWTVEQIPLDRLIDVPLTVIDLSAKVKADRSYNFVKADFMDSTTGKPLVSANSVVLVYTGISQMYDQGKEAYMGTASRNISEMKIPGFSDEAATFLVEQGVYGVGLDSPSADSSQRHQGEGFESFDPVAHVILNSHNIFILENISNKLADLVNVQGARLVIAPLPIVGGSGSQVRLVAMLGHDECHCEHHQHSNDSNGSTGHNYSSLTILITLFLSFVVFLI